MVGKFKLNQQKSNTSEGIRPSPIFFFIYFRRRTPDFRSVDQKRNKKAGKKWRERLELGRPVPRHYTSEAWKRQHEVAKST